MGEKGSSKTSKIKLWGSISILIFVLFHLYGLDRVKATWLDDTMYAAPAYYLAFHGKACYCMERGVALLGKAAMRAPPLYTWLLAAWYKLAGFSVFNTRLLYLIFAAISMLLFYKWNRKLLDRFAISSTTADIISLFSLLILATDQIWVWSIRAGRPDAIGAAFVCLALFLSSDIVISTKRSFAVGLIAGLAILSHPVNAAAATAPLLQISLVNPENRNIRNLSAYVAGVLISLLPWGIMAAFYPEAFKYQFLGNMLFHSNHGKSIAGEFLLRYWNIRYEFQPMNFAIFFLSSTAGTVLLFKNKDIKLWPAVATAVGAIFLFIFVRPHHYYLYAYLPIYYTSAAIMCAYILERKPKLILKKVLLALSITTVGWGIFLSCLFYPFIVVRDGESRSPLMIQSELKRTIPKGSTVIGPVEMWFHAVKCGYDYRLNSLYSIVSDLDANRKAYIASLGKLQHAYILLPPTKTVSHLFPPSRQTFIKKIGKPHSMRFLKDSAYYYNVIKLTP